MKNKVYFFSETPFKYTLDGITYYFTTKTHKEKFVNGYENNREVTNKQLRLKYGVNTCFKLFCDIGLYCKLETKGFYIKYKGCEYEWPDQLVLNGEILTSKELEMRPVPLTGK